MQHVLAMTLIVLLGCAPAGDSDQTAMPTAEVAMSVEPSNATAGDSLTLTLSNESSGPVGYNLCSSRLERSAGNDWEPIRENRMCTLELRTLPPGEQTTYSVQLPPTIEPGEYRFATNVEMLDGTARNLVRSTTFRVTE
jgi:hypothetical protein